MGAFGLHVACIGAGNRNCNVLIVSTEEGRDGMNNERGAEQEDEGGRRRKKDSWYRDWC